MVSFEFSENFSVDVTRGYRHDMWKIADHGGLRLCGASVCWWWQAATGRSFYRNEASTGIDTFIEPRGFRLTRSLPDEKCVFFFLFHENECNFFQFKFDPNDNRERTDLGEQMDLYIEKVKKSIVTNMHLM